MIKLMGLVDLKAVGQVSKKQKIQETELTDKQKQLDVDKDGEIEGSDLAKLRSKNEDMDGDHEVSMAHNSLDTIIQHANELKSKLGQDEKDIPAWIQDHITNAANYIQQAASNYHEYNTPETPETSEAPGI